jgi:hypothetical protein
MTPEKAAKIWRSIRAGAELDHAQLKEDLIEAAIRYARIRADWIRTGVEERNGMKASSAPWRTTPLLTL